ncbi:MAG: efflux RND transporter periplasmic adaptor subunit [Acidobacteria bacterium]|nr:efflux RND transporter periplasmic adaptor subunit [Acidobacteriota bacterium]
MENQTTNRSSAVKFRRRGIIAIVAILVVAIAVTAAIFLMRDGRRNSLAGRPVPEPSGEFAGNSSGATVAPQPGDMLIELPLDKLANAHLKIETVASSPNAPATSDALRTTGTVEPNIYKQVPVLPITGGIVRDVSAQLGDKVTRGQKLAVIFSTELSEAQAGYLKMQAEIERHHHHYRRMEKLVEIGAASREEFEQATAEYKTEQANLSAMRQRLVLLGMSPKQIEDMGKSDQISSLIVIEAPSTGTVLSRTVNVGEVLMAGKELFRIADLSSIWVIGQVYEKDFAVVRIGSPAIITTQAYPGRTFKGRVSYIDPRVEPQTRTAQVRVEVVNPGDMLRLGMFVDVNFGGTPPVNSQSAVSVPRSALQFIGDNQVVYIAGDKPGAFVQRKVMAGAETDGVTQIVSGLNSGEQVVTEGSFLLRAESLKRDPSQLNSTSAATQTSAKITGESEAPHAGDPKIQTVSIVLSEKGYDPPSIQLRRDVPARLIFTRTAEATCGTEVELPELGIRRQLPLNQPVAIDFTPQKSGEITFACGMNMLKGKLIVR